MGPSKLRVVLFAWASGASALPSRGPREPLRLGLSGEENPLADPVPADLSDWASGLEAAQASELVSANVQSLVGDHNLTIAAFDRWSDQTVSGHLLSGEGWETEHTRSLCNIFRSVGGGVGNFLDVGANIGTFSIPMADCLAHVQTRGGSTGRVIAVEGMPPTADHLVVGILANKLRNVDVYTYAVGGPHDTKHVTMSLNPVNKGGSAVKGNKPFTEMDDNQLQDHFHPSKKVQMSAKKVEVKEFNVELTTGDRMLHGNPAMKAIMIAKVDIEGHEGHFIQGSQLLFSKFPPCFMTIELIPEWLERAGTPVQGILDLLISWGYKNVPTVDQLNEWSTRSKTRTVEQKDMVKCLERVRSYAAQQ
jgi:FkbM family methyltransferase